MKQPFALEDPFDEHDARPALQNISRKIRAAEEWHQECVQRAADAEEAYRKGLAQAFVTRRSEGRGAGEAEILAKGDVAHLSKARDVASGMVKASLEVLENRRGDRASLHRLV